MLKTLYEVSVGNSMIFHGENYISIGLKGLKLQLVKKFKFPAT